MDLDKQLEIVKSLLELQDNYYNISISEYLTFGQQYAASRTIIELDTNGYIVVLRYYNKIKINKELTYFLDFFEDICNPSATELSLFKLHHGFHWFLNGRAYRPPENLYE